MTKLLHITTGEFIFFVSSIAYDKKHPNDVSGRVISFEDSFAYSNNRKTIIIEEYIKRYCKEINAVREEFEIIYD